jgi:hypothetical protein
MWIHSHNTILYLHFNIYCISAVLLFERSPIQLSLWCLCLSQLTDFDSTLFYSSNTDTFFTSRFGTGLNGCIHNTNFLHFYLTSGQLPYVGFLSTTTMLPICSPPPQNDNHTLSKYIILHEDFWHYVEQQPPFSIYGLF